MAKTVAVRLTSQAEMFLDVMSQRKVSETEVFAKALWLLQKAYLTNRVVLLKEGYDPEEVEAVESVFVIDVTGHAESRKSLQDNARSGQGAGTNKRAQKSSD